MSNYSHTLHIEEAPSQIQEAADKPPIAKWPHGSRQVVHCQDTSGEKFKYELVEHSAQRAVKAVKSLDESVVRALCIVK